ncbi:hypothetical protein PS2_018270 [Malus domestica]
MPNAEHRHCVRHLYNNFKKKYSGLALKQTLWEAARATTIPWWQDIMDNLQQENKDAWDWLHVKPAYNWSRSRFRTYYKCDILLNNLCEAFNASIVKARDKPILTMLQIIRKNLTVRMANRRVAALKWKGSVGPRIEKIIEKLKYESGHCIAYLVGDMKYQVSHLSGREFAVDLAARTCSCRRWDLCGIPCPHDIACILRKGQDVALYVDDCYKKATYLKAYAPVISPLPGQDQWDKPSNETTKIDPPIYKKQTGRPKKKRAKDPSEEPPVTSHEGKKLKRWIYTKPYACRSCGQEGHTSKTCGKQQNQASTSQSTQGVTQSTNNKPTSTQTRQVGRGSGMVRGRAMGRGTCRERGMISSSQPTIPPIQHVQSTQGFGAKRGKPWKP